MNYPFNYGFLIAVILDLYSERTQMQMIFLMLLSGVWSVLGCSLAVYHHSGISNFH